MQVRRIEGKRIARAFTSLAIVAGMLVSTSMAMAATKFLTTPVTTTIHTTTPVAHTLATPSSPGTDLHTVSVGSGYSTCWINLGLVYCSGLNSVGQLGNNTRVNSWLPVSTGLANATSVSVGWNSACALLSSGAVDCWGDNSSGELGNGSTTDSLTPTPVSNITTAVSISVAANYACAVLANGTVECWGSNANDQIGQTSITAEEYLTPQVIGGITTAASVSAGATSACVVTTSQTVYCWGAGNFYQLGNNSTASSPTPVQALNLTVASTPAAVQVSVGNSAACALLSNGSVYCWGDNAYYVNDNGSQSNVTSPTVISAVSSAAYVSVGYSDACVITTSSTTQCWGQNGSGALGNSTATAVTTGIVTPATTNPLQISVGGTGSSDTACYVNTSATNYCTGSGSYGGLGVAVNDTLTESYQAVAAFTNNAGLTPPSAPASVAVASATGQPAGVVTVTWPSSTPAGNSYTITGYQVWIGTTPGALTQELCSTTSATVYSCTAGTSVNNAFYYSVISVATGATSSPTSTAVPFSVTSSATVLQIASSDQTGDISCALMSDGSVRCWGQSSGQSGFGNSATPISASNWPLTVLGVSTATQITVGGYQVCATLANGTATCWGDNLDGDLGNPSYTLASSVPVPVPSLTNVVQVAANSGNTCARLSSGAVYCWGLNNYYQLGSSSAGANTSTPVLVGGLSNATNIKLGFDYACATTTSTALYCWGSNNSQEFGTSSPSYTATPTLVANVSAFTLLTSALCYVATSPGAVLCQGSNGAVGTLGGLGTGSFASYVTALPVTGVSNAVSLFSDQNAACAVQQNQALYCWGTDNYTVFGDGLSGVRQYATQVGSFTSAVTQYSLGYSALCGILSTGAVQCVGSNGLDQIAPGYTLSGNGVVGYPALGETPQSPSSVQASISSSGNGALAVSWSAPSPLNTQVTGYTVYVGTSPTTISTVGCQTTSYAMTSCQVPGLVAGTSYYVAVVANAGVTTSAPASVASPITIPGIPTAPAFNVAQASATSLISASWDPTQVVVGTSTPTGFTVYFGATPGALTYIACKASISASSCSLTGLPLMQSGYLTLVVNSNGGNSVAATSNVQVTSPNLVTQVAGTAVGAQTDTCVVQSSGAVQCWGSEIDGALGNGIVSSVTTTVPSRVQNISNAISVVVFQYGACALLARGSVDCWGQGTSGALGNGAYVNSALPVPVTGISNAVQLTAMAGAQSVCALLIGGTVDCWGSNSYQLFQNGTTIGSDVPVALPFSSVAQISIGGVGVACVLLTSGTVQCWGNNGNQQASPTGATTVTTPYTETLLGSVTYLSVGYTNVCVVVTGGSAWCWGANGSGEGGNGETSTAVYPTPVLGLSNVISVIADDYSGYHSCAVLANYSVDCWGSGANYELANGISSTSYFATPASSASGAVEGVAVGAGQTCFIYWSGQSQCIGLSAGNNTTSAQSTIVYVAVINGYNPPSAPAQLSISAIPTTVANTAPGTVVASWGSTVPSGNGANITGYEVVYGVAAGQTTYVGCQTTISVFSCTFTAPVNVALYFSVVTTSSNMGLSSPYALANPMTLSAPLATYTQVELGANFGCGLTSSKYVYCWGNDLENSLGSGYYSTTAQVIPWAVAVMGVTNATSVGVSQGSADGCAVVASGNVLCWGYNYYGQLGDGNVAPTAQTQTAFGVTTATAVALSTNQACALLQSGGVDCWGFDTYGNLGNGSTSASASIPMPMDPTWGSGTVVALLPGLNYEMCLLTNATSSNLYCWGQNLYYELGNGTTATSSTATAASLTGHVITAGLTLAGACAIVGTTAAATSGGVYCWGQSSEYEEGQGSISNVTTPTLVSGLTSGVTQLMSAEYSHCALNSTGLYCWGYNVSYAFGAGGTITTPTLDANAPSGVASYVNGGSTNLCAILTSGEVTCQGSASSAGELGNQFTYTPTSTLTPTSNYVTASTFPIEVMSNTVAGPLTASNLTLSDPTKNTTGVTATWVDPVSTGDGSTITGYNVYYGGTLGAATTLLCSVQSATATSCAGTAPSGTAEYYSIGVTTTTGYSPLMINATAFTPAPPPSAPSYLWVDANPGGLSNTYYVSWAASTPASNGSSINGYVVYYGTSIGATSNVGCVVTVASTYHCSIGVTGAGPYYFSVVTTSTQSGNSSLFSNPTGYSNAQSISNTQVTQIALGLNGGCELLANGTVYCWGANASYQAAPASAGTTGGVPAPTLQSGLTNITQIAGNGMTGVYCALNTLGKVYCWGSALDDQLGTAGSSTNTPQLIGGLSSVTVSEISVGQTSACALAAGSVYCWGLGTSNQIGNGGSANATSATAATGLTTATSVVVGQAGACASLANGTVDCWGSNATVGYLGDGSFSNAETVPTAVAGLSGVIQLAGNYETVCALLSSGTVDCWGLNTNGQVGNGATSNVDVPTPVQNLTNIASISGLDETFCATTIAGSIYCWGAEGNGQALLNATSPASVTSPTLTGLSSVTGLVVGYTTSCYINTSAEAFCSGLNTTYARGDGSDSSTVAYNTLLVNSNASQIPAAPATITATQASTLSPNTAAVSWGSSTPSTPGPPVTGYIVYWDLSQGGTSNIACTVTSPTQYSCAASSLPANTPLYFSVVTTTANGSSVLESSSSPLTLYGLPSMPAVTTTAGDGTLTLQWAAVNGNGQTVTGYSAAIGLSAAAMLPTCVGTITGSATLQCTISGLTDGQVYSLSVTATSAAGSVTTPTFSATPAAPANAPSLTLTGGNGQVIITWPTPASNGSVIQQFNILYGTSPSNLATASCAGGITGAGPYQCILTGLANGTTYYFEGQTISSLGITTSADPQSTPTNGPSNPLVTASPGNTSVVLNWSDPALNGSTLSGYTVADGTSPNALSGVSCVGGIVGTGSYSCTISGLVNGQTYYFAVTADSNQGNTSSAPVPATPIGNPVVATVSAVGGANQVTLTWSGATLNGNQLVGYSLLDGTNPNNLVSDSCEYGVTGAGPYTCIVTGLSSSTTYYFQLQLNGSVYSSFSNIAGATTYGPAAPAVVAATAGNAQVILSWAAPATNGVAITGYAVNLGTSVASLQPATCAFGIAGTSSLSCTVNGLTNGSTYYFNVVTTTSLGTSTSTAVSATPIGGPSNPVPTIAAGNGQLTITWAPSTANGSVISGYSVGLGTSLANVTQVSCFGGITGTTTLQCVVTGLTNGTTYTAVVTALSNLGNVASSPLVATPFTTPSVPVVSAVESSGQVTLVWAAPTGNGATISGYAVNMGLSAMSLSSASCQGGITGTTSLQCVITGLTNGTTYYFSVAVLSNAATVSSTVVSSIPNTGPSSPVASVTAGAGQATITWPTPSANGATISGYNVLIGGSVSSLASATCQGGITGSTTFQCLVTGLTNGVTYDVEVVVDSNLGNVTSLPVAFIPYTAPSAPVITAAGGINSVVLTWPAPTLNGSTLTGYALSDGSSSTNLQSDSCSGGVQGTGPFTCAITGLSPLTTYYFQLTLQGTLGSGPSATTTLTSATSLTVSAQTFGAPNAPSVVASTSNAAVTLSWSVPQLNGSTVTNYTVSDGASAGSLSPVSCSGGVTGISTLHCVISGLTNATTYYFAVTVNTNLGSTTSSIVSATPVAGPNSPVPNATAGGQLVTLTWATPAANGAVISGYAVSVGTSAAALSPSTCTGGVTGTSTLTCIVSGLSDATTYYFTVTVNSNLAPVTSAVVAATPVDEPTTPIVSTSVNGTAVTLSWPASHDNGSSITGYQVNEGTSPSGLSPQLCQGGIQGTTTLSCVVNGLSLGLTYYFDVQVLSSLPVVTSAPVSATIAGPPSAPVVIATAGYEFVNLTWSPPSTNGTSITSYTVFAGSAANSLQTVSCTGGMTGTLTLQCTVGNLAPQIAQYFAVSANSVAGDTQSATVSAAPFGTPAIPVLSAVTASQSITLTWAAPSANGSVIAGYQVMAGTSPSSMSPATCDGGITGSSTLSCLLDSLTNGDTYSVAVVVSSNAPPVTSNILSETPYGPPAQPVVSATSSGSGSVTLNWTPSLTNGSVISGYSVSAGSSLLTLAPVSCAGGITGSSLFSCVVTGLTDGQSYEFGVVADASTGNSIMGTVSGEPVDPPSSLTISVSVTSSGAVLTWSVPANNGASISGYSVNLGSAANALSSASCSGGIIGTTTLSCSLANLNPSTTYFYDVSVLSNLSTVTTSPATFVTTAGSNSTNQTATVVLWGPPAAPVVTFTQTGINTGLLSWTEATPSNIISNFVVLTPTGISCASASTQSCTFSEITANTFFYVSVAAYSIFGFSTSSSVLANFLATPPASPLKVSATRNATTVLVQWLAPGTAMSSYGPSDGALTYKVTNARGVTLCTTSALACAYSISSSSFTNEIFVYAMSGSGLSSATAATVIRQALKGPSVTLQRLPSGHVLVSWTAPKNLSGSRVASYSVYVGARLFSRTRQRHALLLVGTSRPRLVFRVYANLADGRRIVGVGVLAPTH